MASFGTLAPGQQDPEDELLRSQPADSVDWSRFNQPFGQLSDPRGAIVAGAGKPWEMRQSDIDRAINIGMSVSGGGLATEVPAKSAINWDRTSTQLGGGGIPKDHVVMDVSTDALRAAQKATDPQEYVQAGVGNTRAQKKLDAVRQHIQSGAPVSMAEVHANDRYPDSNVPPVLNYINGRNRVAVAHEMGEPTVPVVVHKDNVDTLNWLLNQFDPAQFKTPGTTYASWLDALEGKTHGAPDMATGQPAAAPAAPEAGLAGAGGDVTRGAGGRDPRLAAAQAQAERVSGGHDPLPGLPTKAVDIGGDLYVPGPIGKVKDVAEGYMRDRLRPTYHTPPDKYYPLDPEHSKNIAQAYEEMNHEPDNPAVKASYDQMIRETRDQYRYIRANHPELQIEPITGPDPYGATPRMAAADVAHNNHLYFYPTEQGFGTSAQGGIDMATHPMMQPSGETLNGQPLLNNDLFRIVHDYFGHLKEGYGFRAAGEDNAWRSHASMYSDLARPAMTTETRGQNSWVNYGPHGDFNRTASAGDMRYADQKVGLMPEWTMRDRGSPEPINVYQGSASAHPQIDMSKVGTGEGTAAFGAGMYGAGHEPVATVYRHQLAAANDPLAVQHGLAPDQAARLGMEVGRQGGNAQPVIDEMTDYLNQHLKNQAAGDTSPATRNSIDRTQRMINYLNDPNRAKGHMYQMAIDQPEDRFIQWEKPLSQQSDHVKSVMQPIVDEVTKKAQATQAMLLAQARQRLAENPSPVIRKKLERDIANFSKPIDYGDLTGDKLYLLAAHHEFGLNPPDQRLAAPAATKALREQGIAGVKYLDRYSRGGPSVAEPTYNYVAFHAPRILKRYAIPGMLGTGLAASMMSRGQQENGT